MSGVELGSVVAAAEEQEPEQNSLSGLLVSGFHLDLFHWHLSDRKKETFPIEWMSLIMGILTWCCGLFSVFDGFFQCFLQSSSICSMT